MQVDPDLKALRRDPAAQRRAQTPCDAARDGWRAHPQVQRIQREMAEWGDGAPLSECPALTRLVTGADTAAELVGALVRGQLSALAGQPLGQVPLRHQMSDGLAIVQLLTAARASLSLIAYEQRAKAPAETAICFTDSERYEIVLAGSAQADIVTLAQDYETRVSFARRPAELEPGVTLHLPGFDHAKHLTRIEGRLVVLRLARTPERPLPTRQFDLATGELVHRASGDRRESRQELAMAVLGRMRRNDAAPIVAEMTRQGSDHLRWQALRECLALDTAAGFRELCALASNAADPLSSPAAALRGQLLDRHPQLTALTGNDRCRASC